MNVPPKQVSLKLKALSSLNTAVTDNPPPQEPAPQPIVPKPPAKEPAPVPVQPVTGHASPVTPDQPAPSVSPQRNRTSEPQDLPAVKSGPKGIQKPAPSSLARTPESLPVLEAFQEFLESERQRAQNRMLALTFFFAFVLFLFLGAAAFIGITLLSQMRTDYQDLEKEVMTYRQNAMRAEGQLALAATRVENETARIRARIDEETRGLLAQARQDIESRTGQLDAKMEELRKLIHTLETEDDLAKTPPPAAEREVAKTAGIAMTIRMPDGKTTVPWRLPILE